MFNFGKKKYNLDDYNIFKDKTYDEICEFIYNKNLNIYELVYLYNINADISNYFIYSKNNNIYLENKEPKENLPVLEEILNRIIQQQIYEEKYSKFDKLYFTAAAAEHKNFTEHCTLPGSFIENISLEDCIYIIKNFYKKMNDHNIINIPYGNYELFVDNYYNYFNIKQKPDITIGIYVKSERIFYFIKNINIFEYPLTEPPKKLKYFVNGIEAFDYNNIYKTIIDVELLKCKTSLKLSFCTQIDTLSNVSNDLLIKNMLDFVKKEIHI